MARNCAPMPGSIRSKIRRQPSTSSAVVLKGRSGGCPLGSTSKSHGSRAGTPSLRRRDPCELRARRGRPSRRWISAERGAVGRRVVEVARGRGTRSRGSRRNRRSRPRGDGVRASSRTRLPARWRPASAAAGLAPTPSAGGRGPARAGPGSSSAASAPRPPSSRSAPVTFWYSTFSFSSSVSSGTFSCRKSSASVRAIRSKTPYRSAGRDLRCGLARNFRWMRFHQGRQLGVTFSDEREVRLLPVRRRRCACHGDVARMRSCPRTRPVRSSRGSSAPVLRAMPDCATRA